MGYVMKIFLNKQNKNIVVDLCDIKSLDGFVELKANETDGAKEKHVPVVEKNGDEIVVKVGSVSHPMLVEHFIEFIIIETAHGFQIKYLAPGDEPIARFKITSDDKAIAAYEYCNLHGLWKAKI